MTEPLDLCTPWSLHFDRDGTEDFGIICDANGDTLAASHLPCTRLGEGTFQTGTFWRPEARDPTPILMSQLRVMTVAPKLLNVAARLRELCSVQANLNSTASEAERSRFISGVYDLWNSLGCEAVAEATGDE